MKKNSILLAFLILISFTNFYGQQSVKIGLLKYKGGGDWYANPTSLPNLIKFCNNNLRTSIQMNDIPVEVGVASYLNFHWFT
jgi:hypothetical protein